MDGYNRRSGPVITPLAYPPWVWPASGGLQGVPMAIVPLTWGSLDHSYPCPPAGYPLPILVHVSHAHVKMYTACIVAGQGLRDAQNEHIATPGGSLRVHQTA